jgi:hypothetical protein
MRTARTEEISRQRKAADNMTEAKKLHQKLGSGAIKSELRTVPETIHLASTFYRQAQQAIKQEYKKLDSENGFALVIAYLTPDLSNLFTRKYMPGEEGHIYRELSTECCIMVGLIFGVRDPEHNNDWLIGGKPFLNTPLVIDAMKQRISSDVIGIN